MERSSIENFKFANNGQNFNVSVFFSTLLLFLYVFYAVSLCKGVGLDYISTAVNVVSFILIGFCLFILNLSKRSINKDQFYFFMLMGSCSLLTLNYMAFFNLAAIFVAVNIFNFIKAKHLKKTLVTISISFVIIVFYLVVSHNLQGNVVGNDVYALGGRVREKFFFVNANYPTLLIFCSLVIFFIYDKKAWMFGSLILFLYVSVKTDTRSSFFALTLSALYYVFVRLFYNKKSFVFLNMLIFSLILAIGIGFVYLSGYVVAHYPGLNHLFSYRFSAYQAAVFNDKGLFNILFGASDFMSFENFFGVVGRNYGVISLLFFVYYFLKSAHFRSVNKKSIYKKVLTFQLSFALYGVAEGLFSARLFILPLFLLTLLSEMDKREFFEIT